MGGERDLEPRPRRDVITLPRARAPLISVVIPTYEARRTIVGCLESVLGSTTSKPEIIVVDSESTDGTSRLAAPYARVIELKSSITRARLEGVKVARGEFVLNLDADQILSPGVLDQCLSSGCDAAVLEEVALGRGLIARINRLDKRAAQRDWSSNLADTGGPVVPRFYRRSLLLHALLGLPPSIIDLSPSPPHEDALVFRLMRPSLQKIGFVPEAIAHNEEESISRYVRKWIERGKAASRARGTAVDWIVRTQGRRAGGGRVSLLTFPARALRGVPFLLGYYLA